MRTLLLVFLLSACSSIPKPVELPEADVCKTEIKQCFDKNDVCCVEYEAELAPLSEEDL